MDEILSQLTVALAGIRRFADEKKEKGAEEKAAHLESIRAVMDERKLEIEQEKLQDEKTPTQKWSDNKVKAAIESVLASI